MNYRNDGDNQANWNNSWDRFNMRMPTTMKTMIVARAAKLNITQSEGVRKGIEMWLLDTAETDDEKATSKTLARQRQERVKLTIPKDKFTTWMIPHGAMNAIRKDERKRREDGTLRPEVYNSYIEILEDNRDSIQISNSQYDLLMGDFDILVEQMEEKRDRLQHEDENDTVSNIDDHIYVPKLPSHTLQDKL